MNTLPVWFPVFRLVPGPQPEEIFIIQYKPYPSYPTWITMVDLLPMMQQLILLIYMPVVEELANINSRIDLLGNDLAATDAVANQAITDAATAYGFAETNDINRTNDIAALDARITALENA